MLFEQLGVSPGLVLPCFCASTQLLGTVPDPALTLHLTPVSGSSG